MSSDQVQGIIRIVLGFFGGLLVSKGLDQTAVGNAISAIVDAVPTLMSTVGAVIPVVAGALSLMRHTEVGNAQAAAQADGVKVVVDPVRASSALLDVANNPNIAGVVRQPAGFTS
jgi:hypothetical protein